MRISLAILLAAVSALSACDRLDAVFDGDSNRPSARSERPESIDFTVDAKGVYYATRGTDGKIHNAQKVERIPIAERATTFVYVEGRTPNLRGEEVRYVANLVGAQSGDQHTAVLRTPDFVKASELAGLDGARAAIGAQRQTAAFLKPDAQVEARDALRRGTSREEARPAKRTESAGEQAPSIKIESVGGKGATNSLGFGNSKSVGWKSVTVYYADWCGVCKQAMSWMNTNDVPYRAVDIEASDRNQREMIEFCREKNRAPNSVPTIRIGDDIMKGWSASRFQKLAKL